MYVYLVLEVNTWLSVIQLLSSTPANRDWKLNPYGVEIVVINTTTTYKGCLYPGDELQEMY